MAGQCAAGPDDERRRSSGGTSPSFLYSRKMVLRPHSRITSGEDIGQQALYHGMMDDTISLSAK